MNTLQIVLFLYLIFSVSFLGDTRYFKIVQRLMTNTFVFALANMKLKYTTLIKM